jgi:hypothetical protein
VTAILLVLTQYVVCAQSSHPRTRTTPLMRGTSNKEREATDFNSLTPSESDRQYFPEVHIVLDMAILSNAVPHLRNKVQSCHDKTLIHLSQDEMEYDEFSSDTSNNQTSEDIFQLLLPEGVECLHYSHDYSLGTQVLVVRSSLHKYVAVAYAGTDDWRTALSDGDILTGDFGPNDVDDNSTSSETQYSDDFSSIFDDVPDGVRIHRGFNSAVFGGNGLQKILDCVASAQMGGNCDGDDNADDGSAGDADTNTQTNLSSAPYQIFTTGHSLGAANSVLLGATMHLLYSKFSPNESIRTINFGCPKIGNAQWSFWVDSLQPGAQKDCDTTDCGGSFEVFRFVNKIDLIPRLPEDPLFNHFTHAGHTLQMSLGGEIRAYYDHIGDEDRGYSGVPFGWEAAAYALLPGALVNHMSKHYVKFLTSYQPKIGSNSSHGSALYYVRDFERVDNVSQIISEG